MRVLHVVAPAEFGGLERVVQNLAAAQQAAGDHVVVSATTHDTTRGQSDRFLAPLRTAGVFCHELSVGSRAYLAERLEIGRLCRAARPDVVHTHGYRPDFLARSPAHRSGAAVVSTVHGFTNGDIRNRAYEWLQRRALRRFDAVVAVSAPLAHALVRSGLRARRVHAVTNHWVPTTRILGRRSARDELGLSPSPFLIGWVGRLSHEKGLDVMIDALEKVLNLPVTLVVIGSGREQASLEARAVRRSVGERIVWCGTIPDAARFFRAFDAFVLSSRTEGTPIALLEAMAAGVPVIASAVGGVPDIIGDRDAYLVPADDASRLATAVRTVFNDPAGAAVRAARARIRLSELANVTEWVDAYRRVYSAAIQETRAVT